MKNNWYIITGGPSSGKSTLLAELEELGYKTIPEAARTLIDEAVLNGISVEKLRADEQLFQENVAKLKHKIESELDTETVTFFDRGMHDTLAYMRHYGFNVAQWINKYSSDSHYSKVLLLDQLPDFEKDYARTEDSDFARDINQLLFDAYDEYGMTPIRIPAVGVDKRVKMVMDNINMEEV